MAPQVRRFIFDVLFPSFVLLLNVLSSASAASPRTPISLRPDDVLPTGNQWISLPDIRASDGALGTFNVLSMHHRGLLQVSGDKGSPVLQPYFSVSGKPLAFQNPSWELIQYWIPAAYLTIDGLEATRRIVARGIAARVLVLTTFDVDDYVYEAMKAGASGFLLKTAPPRQLADAVRTVAAGEALLAPSITRRLVEQFVRRPPPGTAVPAAVEELTERERDVLRLLARAFSNAEIAAELVVSEATVKSHVNRILTKLNLRDRAQAIVLAYETGLVEPGSSASNSRSP